MPFKIVESYNMNKEKSTGDRFLGANINGVHYMMWMDDYERALKENRITHEYDKRLIPFYEGFPLLDRVFRVIKYNPKTKKAVVTDVKDKKAVNAFLDAATKIIEKGILEKVDKLYDEAEKVRRKI